MLWNGLRIGHDARCLIANGLVNWRAPSEVMCAVPLATGEYTNYVLVSLLTGYGCQRFIEFWGSLQFKLNNIMVFSLLGILDLPGMLHLSRWSFLLLVLVPVLIVNSALNLVCKHLTNHLSRPVAADIWRSPEAYYRGTYIIWTYRLFSNYIIHS